MSAKPLKIYFDGGCRPNPGRIEVAIVARGQTYVFDDLGDGSSSDAEWLALRCALDVARRLEASDFILLGDSRSVIEQATGTVPSRSPDQRAHLARYREQAAAAPPCRLRWLPRQQNLAGIALARRRQGR